MGGADGPPAAGIVTVMGSPPRGRGGPDAQGVWYRHRRLTPAWAGRTGDGDGQADLLAAHPRVGGADDAQGNFVGLANGSPPRGRGGQGRLECRRVLGRLTPAWAGRTVADPPPRQGASAHPRVGGADPEPGEVKPFPDGSPPRGRGGHRVVRAGLQALRLTPAWAGRTGYRPSTSTCSWAHPRVGGADSGVTDMDISDTGSPPRGRGGRISRRRHSCRSGLTPAWAGRTSPSKHQIR